MGKADLKKWYPMLVRVLPIAVMVGWVAWAQWGHGGWKGFVNLGFWISEVLVVAGWVMGWMLAEVEEMPIVKQKFGEFITPGRPAIKNILTVAVLAAVGVWIVTSSGSLLAIGLVIGMEVAMVWSYLTGGEQEKWYWIFARKFSVTEQKTVLFVWLLALVVQLGLFMRR